MLEKDIRRACSSRRQQRRSSLDAPPSFGRSAQQAAIKGALWHAQVVVVSKIELVVWKTTFSLIYFSSVYKYDSGATTTYMTIIVYRWLGKDSQTAK